MTSTSFEPGWQWPENLPGRYTTHEEDTARQEPARASYQRSTTDSSESTTFPRPTPTSGNTSRDEQPTGEQQQKFYGPRTCRICLEVIQPTYEIPSEHLPGVLQGMPKVSYVSDEGGRLIRPCLCKGSQRYVHEGCLAAWRLQDPSNKRNYWHCPTCKYNYRLERLTWAHWLGSTASQIGLTISVFIVTIFILGFIADPIINMYLDPYTTVAYGYEDLDPIDPDSVTLSWIEHFAKGFASLGLLGFAKFLLTLSPLYWWNVRGSGGGRAGATGRDRLQNLNWLYVLIGVSTFLWAVWKGIRAWSKRTLTRASERVMDVPLAGDDGDD